ncbi:hypothetical protein Tsubulata_047010 [Turnera subulata]|uniref:Peptidase A1 domain-containing protein n=1 Tax=Turnera subulata TaxID=218843 RepID=A0A9Q0JDE0_9ROSI|nr:hypothetical protein Tsubulata_047010 [Turnera subulata]
MTKISTSLTRFSYASLLLLLCILCSLQKEHAVEANLDSQNIIHTHTLKVSSLLDSDVCDRSSQGFKKGSSLEVVHSYGPCNQAKAGDGPSTAELLRQDRLRSDSIQASLAKKSGSGSVKQTKATLPTQSGSAIGLGTSNYVVTLGLGTPRKNVSLVFDTAKDLTWTQCEPCTGGCSPQKGPKFDPTKSASYKNISCSSSLCDLADKQAMAMFQVMDSLPPIPSQLGHPMLSRTSCSVAATKTKALTVQRLGS